MNIFELASRAKYRFSTTKGDLTVEHLWDLPLQSRGGHLDLDTVARSLHTALKATTEESFVSTSSNPNKVVLEEKLEIVKHIIKTRIEENRVHSERANRQEEVAKLKALLGKKNEQALETLTPEQILDRINKLEASAS